MNKEADDSVKKAAEEAKRTQEEAVEIAERTIRDLVFLVGSEKETGETRQRTKREAEEIRRAKKAEAKARKGVDQAAEEKAEQEAEEARARTTQEVEEAKQRAKREAEEARQKVRREAEEKAQKATRQVVNTELSSGMVRLAIVSPADYERVKKFEEYLRRVKDLRVAMVSGSVDKGTRIVVTVEKPIALASTLSEMPPVERVIKKGNEIQITLKVR